MVLTNFECWAHGDPSSSAATFETGALRPSMDPFNPRAVTFMTDANNNNDGNHVVGQPMPAFLPQEVPRCKKRLNPAHNPAGYLDTDQPVHTKRCRYDEGDLAAQYCNDFFSLPATQIIGTQASLMDYEMQATGGMMMESETSFPAQQQQHQQPHPQQQHHHQRIHQHYQGHLHRANRDNPQTNECRPRSQSQENLKILLAKSNQSR
ncbi:uncharacterized protein Dere_GG13306, isoform A [Drosophila erecta]|uniref:Uncharacterized protein, isoform A n=1 Tax=Drosophila erecta TaxID=7220 RepID=B3NIM9_DROER|nr:uncharacterized protein Dere_GG13306, isoform A [Drosophila erecta]